MNRADIRHLQGFLAEQGFKPGPIDGMVGRKTTRALQGYLKENIDRTVVVDGKWGPHTTRAFNTFKATGILDGGTAAPKTAAPKTAAPKTNSEQMSGADRAWHRVWSNAPLPPSAGVTRPTATPTRAQREKKVGAQEFTGKPVRLVMHTAHRKISDVRTFDKHARFLVQDYRRHYRGDDVQQLFIQSGEELVNAINRCPKGSIRSWDVLSHSNFGGIHISRDLATPKAPSGINGWIQRRAHVKLRKDSDRPQSKEDAEMMEEAMNGLYAGWAAAKAVSYYFNQEIVKGTAHLSDIEFDRFADDAYVEFHGCKTAEQIPQLERFFDNFVKNVSEELSPNALVVGHIDRSSPNGRIGYRHGTIRVFSEGAEVQKGPRRSMKFANSSTPGANPQVEGALRAKAQHHTQRQAARPLWPAASRGSGGGSPSHSAKGDLTFQITRRLRSGMCEGTLVWRDKGMVWKAVSGPLEQGVLPQGLYSIDRRGISAYTQAIDRQFQDRRTGRGFFVPIMPDFHTTRGTAEVGRFGIHPDGAEAGTAGCIGLVNNSKAFYDAVASTPRSAQLVLQVK